MLGSNIPSDIQEEIIIRLPVKSLVRFRSVSKAWKSLISSSEFIAAYSLRRTRPHHLLISYKIRDWREPRGVKYGCFVDDDTFPQQNCVPTLSSLVDDGKSIKLGSSHGLVCFFSYFFQGNPQATAVLWNPSVNKSIAVVVPHVLRSPIPGVVGFGVCPHSGDPKLVKITYDNPFSEMEHMPWHVMVFSVSSKKWTIPCNKPPRKSLGLTWSQATVGQFIYFLAFDRQGHGVIMSFDMSIEEFIEVKLPSCLARTCFTSLSISRLRDSLALLQSTIDLVDIITKQVIDVWMMEQGDLGSFTKLYTIKPPYFATIETPLGFRESGEPIINMISYGHDSQKLVVYEPFSEHFQDPGISVNRFHTFVNSYMESLLLLNEEDECIYLPLDGSFEDEDDGLDANRGGVKS